MNQADLISEVAKLTGLPKGKVAHAVKALFKIIGKTAKRGAKIQLNGLGSFILKPDKPRRKNFFFVAKQNQTVKLQRKSRVMFRFSRKAVAELNRKSYKSTKKQRKFGGNREMAEENPTANTQTTGETSAAYGLDVGTSRLVLASGAAEKAATSTELNAFITVPYSKITENILKQNKITYSLNDGNLIQVYGNEAGRFANVFNVEIRRPMMAGTLNPNEENATAIIQAIMKQLLQRQGTGEILRFSVPGPGRDGGIAADLVYHEAMLKKWLDAMGYNSKGVNEGMAVVFAELEKENFTGIGISCGGGMCNVALAFMSIPVMTFSTSKAGDYIDRSASSVTGDRATRIRDIKEKSLDLLRPPENKQENALHIYYDDVILSLVETLRGTLSETRNMPALDRPVPIVLAGGTAAPHGFLEKFQKAVEQDKFPVPISEIRVAKDPLTATARGCLIAALYDA